MKSILILNTEPEDSKTNHNKPNQNYAEMDAREGLKLPASWDTTHHDVARLKSSPAKEKKTFISDNNLLYKVKNYNDKVGRSQNIIHG